MAIAFRSYAYAEEWEAGTILSIGKPPGTVDDDVMLALIRCNNTGFYASCSGWTQLCNTTPATGNPPVTVLWKRASSEGASYDFRVAAYYTTVHGIICSYSGCINTGSPINVYSNTEYTDSNTTIRAAGVTTTSNNCMLVFLGSASWGLGSYSSTPPTDFAERYDGVAAFNYFHLIVSDYVQEASGSSGDKDATLSNTAGDQKHAFLVALQCLDGGTGAVTAPAATLSGVGQSGAGLLDVSAAGALTIASPALSGSMWMDSAHLRHLGGKAMLWGAKGRAEILGLKGKASM